MATARDSKTRHQASVSRETLLQQEMKTKGFADVMVSLTAATRGVPARAQAAAAGHGAALGLASLGAEAGFTDEAQKALPPDLLNCFESSYELSTEAGFASLSLRAPQEDRKAPAISIQQAAPVQYLDKLGTVLGSVSSAGLKALRGHSMVREVRPIPELTLVRPRRIAQAQPTPDISWGIERMNIPYLWKQNLEGQGIKVGHLDTGADGTHPMLQGAFAAFAETNYVGRLVDPPPPEHDTDIHGTHTAATIVGRPVNGYRMGVAPKAQLASAIVIEGGRVTFRILVGLNWILKQGVRVVSMSLGLPGRGDEFLDITDKLRELGVLLVVAIGNEGAGTSRYPGNYRTVLSVGAADTEGRVAQFSSSEPIPPPRNRIVPDLVGPGVAIVSAAPGNRYMSMDGTSMATPHIAGLAALLFQARPDATPDQVQKAICDASQRTNEMTRERANRGMPDGKLALESLLNSK